MPGIRLMDRCGRDRRVGVGLKPLGDLLGARSVRREWHEEMPVHGRGVGRRVLVAGDRDHGALEWRRRLDRADLSLWERDQLALHQEGARLRGPVLVTDAHLLWRGGVILVELEQERVPGAG